jgi:signal peptidase I
MKKPRWLILFFIAVITALVVAVATWAHFGRYEHQLYVTSDSMTPTLKKGDVVEWTSKFQISDLERGQLIVIASPAGGDSLWVRRIVGLEGDLVEVDERGLMLNGAKLHQFQFLEPGEDHSSFAHRKMLVPRSAAYYLGDNLTNSRDSREFGAIELEEIKGVVVEEHLGGRSKMARD